MDFAETDDFEIMCSNMDSLATDDQLTIVNRSTKHRISKQLIRKIPYFEKMLNHDSKESKVDEIELDFDGQAFKAILDWTKRDYTIILIKMNYVIDLCELADHLGLDMISKECSLYFEDNFTIEHLPAVIPKVTKTSKCINSDGLNAFICRYFLKIKNLYSTLIDSSMKTCKKTFWLEYPVETIEYICTLDLMIHSEMQVFEAIMSWVCFDSNLRKCHLERLLKLVRWCHLEDTDLKKIKENVLFSSSGFEPILCSPQKVDCACTFNRTKQKYFVIIESLQEEKRIKVLDNNLIQLFNQIIDHPICDPIPRKLFNGEHISDINFGNKVLRIDWKLKKGEIFRDNLSFDVLQRCVISNNENDQPLSLDLSHVLLPGDACEDGYVILETDEAFNLIVFKDGFLNYYSRPSKDLDRCGFRSMLSAILLDKAIYLLSNGFALYEFKIQDNKLVNTWSHRLCGNKSYFEDTVLTPSPAGDEIMLIDKRSWDYISFNVNTKVSSTGRMVSYSDGRKDSKTLVTFTQAFLPLNTIRTCIKFKSLGNSQ